MNPCLFYNKSIPLTAKLLFFSRMNARYIWVSIIRLPLPHKPIPFRKVANSKSFPLNVDL